MESWISSVVVARMAFVTMGFIMLITLVYTIITDGSPFRKDLLTPWMNATLIDFYLNVAAIATWVVYKEPTWIGAFIWTILLICLGSMVTCWYIAIQLFKISPQDPLYLVLLRDRHARKGG
ncbi:uncharacterized protein LOC131029910 isoform X2 [Cryptomeria japonica]|uniref:uncharacterized protein LOC131029910 isoform X2 n=1 Tax=Cryptomeria japonica TaxID=3369 RepID=UPI0025AB68B2|nr:uncharacterized protein LOC131029910 isoform X2 [Cryptomeria japonica]